MSTEHITIRLEKSLLEQIDGFSKAKNLSRSNAIQHLLDLGLKLNNIQENNSTEFDQDIQMMTIENWLLSAQIHQMLQSKMDKTILAEMPKKFREIFSSKYPDAFAKYTAFAETEDLKKKK